MTADLLRELTQEGVSAELVAQIGGRLGTTTTPVELALCLLEKPA